VFYKTPYGNQNPIEGFIKHGQNGQRARLLAEVGHGYGLII
jgi:hypothetical protein